MRARISRLFLRPEPPSLLAGLLVAVLAVALNTSLIYPLREIASADPSGVAYPLAVLLVATLGASGLGLLTSVLSAARSTISISRRRGSSPSRTAAAGSAGGLSRFSGSMSSIRAPTACDGSIRPRQSVGHRADDFGGAHGCAPGVVGSVESDDDSPRVLGHYRKRVSGGLGSRRRRHDREASTCGESDTGGIWSIGLLEPIRHACEDDPRLEQQ